MATARRVQAQEGKDFDKYAAYGQTIQSSDNEAVFLQSVYRDLRKKDALVLREDFCGSFMLCCDWVRQNPGGSACGVDLDPEPIAYGRRNYLPGLSPSERSRVQVLKRDVLSPGLPKADVICAVNFSSYALRDRKSLLAYFKNCRKSLTTAGVLALDCFGGSGCQGSSEEAKKFENLTYYWEQETFDPVTNFTTWHIHFREHGGPKIEKVFTYEWRMWTIPELRELMLEAGFKATHVYWEGTDKKGRGNGEYERVEAGEPCDTWVAYVVGER